MGEISLPAAPVDLRKIRLMRNEQVMTARKIRNEIKLLEQKKNKLGEIEDKHEAKTLTSGAWKKGVNHPELPELLRHGFPCPRYM